jgi:hypothetical protein
MAESLAHHRNGGKFRQAHNCRMHLARDFGRRMIMLTLLTLSSGNAPAAWVEVGGNEHTSTYADAETIRKSGNAVRMWHLVDHTKARAIAGIKPYLSIKMLDEYDCAQERTRTLSLSLHSGNMGEGELLGTVNTPGDWRPVPPDTLVETLSAFACGKW